MIDIFTEELADVERNLEFLEAVHHAVTVAERCRRG